MKNKEAKEELEAIEELKKINEKEKTFKINDHHLLLKPKKNADK